MEKTKWQDLIVSDDSGPTGDTLQGFVNNAPANLDAAVIENGQIAEWPQFILSAPGEDADFDTPRGPVDWTGFEDELNAHRGS